MIQEEFKALLKLELEIDAKIDEFIERVKVLLKSERDAKGKARLIVELDGEIFELRKIDQTQEAIDLCRKHNGFFHDYRIVSLGRPAK
jgi:predicted nucleic-acid-binding protein